MTHPSPLTTPTERRLWPVPTTATNIRKEPYGPTLPPHDRAPTPVTSVTAAAVANADTAVAEGVVGPSVPSVSRQGSAELETEGDGGRDTAPCYPLGFSDQAAELEAQGDKQIIRARAWLPPIDPAVFDCYLGHLADRIDPHTQADRVGVLVSLLAAAGVHLGPGPHLELGYGQRHPLLIWPMLIGPTGIGQKGTATDAALTLVRQADPVFRECNVHSGLSSGEGLSEAFAVQTDKDGKPTGKPGLLPEGDCRLLTYEEEWGTVMARMKREGNTLGSLLRNAWQGGNLSTLNVNARMVTRSHLGIIAHITPKEFTGKVSATDMAGGTYNRFLPIAVTQSKFHPPMMSDTLAEYLAASLAERLHHAASVTVIGFTEEAEWEWRRLHIEFSSHLGDDGPVEEFISRAGGNCVRIAAIYAVLDRTNRITPEHLAAAAALIRYSIASANAVLRPARDDAARRLVAFITDAGPDGRTKSEITTGHFKNAGSAETRDALLDQVVGDGRITMTRRPRSDGKTGGRQAQVYVTATGDD